MKNKLSLLLFAFFFLAGCSSSGTITGLWTGSMVMNGKSVDIAFFFNSEKNLFSSKDLMLREGPVANMKYENGIISFSYISDVHIRFEGKLENDKINGMAAIQGGSPDMKITFNLIKQSDTPPAKTYVVEKLSVKSGGANLSAEIFTPKTKTLHPALVLLHGSVMNLKYMFNYYADYFVSLGFEVLIFDKRGYGESTGNNVTATYTDLADDAVACLQTLKNRTTVDKSRIGLWGISQGGMLLPFVASRTDISSFFIAVSPEIVSVVEGGAYADSIRVRQAGYSPMDGHIAAESHKKVGQMILDGNDYKTIGKFINQNALKYEFMNRTGLYGNITISKEQFEGLYWKERMVNFYPYWVKLNIPTLVMLGEDDELLNTLKNNSLLKAMNNKSIEVRLIPRANHMMKQAFIPAKYPDFDWPRVAPGYFDYIERWLKITVKN